MGFHPTKEMRRHGLTITIRRELLRPRPRRTFCVVEIYGSDIRTNRPLKLNSVVVQWRNAKGFRSSGLLLHLKYLST